MAEKSVIASLRAHIGQLIADHRRLGNLCDELGGQCATLKAENRALQERIREMERELSRLQLAAGLTGNGRDREKARARVNRLMREVDKCIALLGTTEQP